MTWAQPSCPLWALLPNGGRGQQVVGGVPVLVWKLLLKPLGGLWGVCEGLPSFLISCAVIVGVSLPPPSPEIEAEFEAARG